MALSLDRKTHRLERLLIGREHLLLLVLTAGAVDVLHPDDTPIGPTLPNSIAPRRAVPTSYLLGPNLIAGHETRRTEHCRNLLKVHTFTSSVHSPKRQSLYGRRTGLGGSMHKGHERRGLRQDTNGRARGELRLGHLRGDPPQLQPEFLG